MPEEKTKLEKRDLSMVFAGAAVALLIWFIAANSGKVGVTLWVVTVHISLSLVIILSALLGAVVGLWLRGRKKRNRG